MISVVLIRSNKNHKHTGPPSKSTVVQVHDGGDWARGEPATLSAPCRRPMRNERCQSPQSGTAEREGWGGRRCGRMRCAVEERRRQSERIEAEHVTARPVVSDQLDKRNQTICLENDDDEVEKKRKEKKLDWLDQVEKIPPPRKEGGHERRRQQTTTRQVNNKSPQKNLLVETHYPAAAGAAAARRSHGLFDLALHEGQMLTGNLKPTVDEKHLLHCSFAREV